MRQAVSHLLWTPAETKVGRPEFRRLQSWHENRESHIRNLNSRIPFYRLPEAHRAMSELRQTKTSLHPRNIFKCLPLKAWCVESQRMVGVHGL